MQSQSGVHVPLWCQGYALYVKLCDLTPGSSADKAVFFADVLDETLLSAVAKVYWLPGPDGGGALFNDIKSCLEFIPRLTEALDQAGALVSVGISYGYFERHYAVDAWGHAGVALNTAARLASIETVQGRVAVDSDLLNDICWASTRYCTLCGPEQKAIKKKTEFRYRLLAEPCLQIPKQPRTKQLPDVTVSTANVVSFDIEEYSKKSPSEQVELRTKLFKYVEESLTSVGGQESEWAPAGDGGQVVFLSGNENPAPQTWTFVQSLFDLTQGSRLPLRIGIENGPVAKSKYRAAVGGTLLRADQISSDADTRGIAVSAKFWAGLPDRFKKGLQVAPSGSDAAVLIISGRPTTQPEATSKPELEIYVNAPALPANYVDRPEALGALRDAILKSDSRSIALTALGGMGGIGKSVLAQALCHDPAVQQLFPDGIIWVTAGKESDYDLVTRMREIGKAFGDDLSLYDTELGCKNRYRSIMRNKAALIMVDDVWSARDIQPFRAESPRSRLVFTTRMAEIAAALGAREYWVNLLTEEQSRELLASGSAVARDELPSEAEDLIRECSRLPLAVAMIGAMLRGKPRSSWKRVVEHLRNADLGKIRAQFPDYPHIDLLRSIQVSVDALDATAQERYFALAVLLDDMAVHPVIQQTLWNVDPSEAEETAERFISLSLAQREDESIRLHDLQLDYVRAQYADREALRLIHGAVRLSSHVIMKDPLQFASQIVGRLLPYEGQTTLREFAAFVAKAAPRPWIRPLNAALHPPDKDLNARLRGHAEWINGVAVTPDGLRALSASWDHTLKLWDLETGSEMRTLEGHSDWVNGVAVTPDGQRAVSASADYTLKVWDLDTGRELRTLQGHQDAVRAVAVSPDGKHAISASADHTLIVWHLETGRALRTLEGHTGSVSSVAVIPDGQHAVSASSDNTLKIWDVETGRALRSLEGHCSSVRGVAISADGRLAVSACADETLKMWDLETGRELRTLEGHSEAVAGVAVTGDGRQAVSASWDTTLKVWDLDTGRALRTLEGHSDAVTAVALSINGRRAVSASSDNSLKVWDLESGQVLRTLEGHSGFITSVAVASQRRSVVSVSGDRTLKLWDLETGRVLRTFEGHSGFITGVAVSADGRRAVSASRDKLLKVWDLETGRELRTLEGHSGFVTGVAVSPDGRRAVSASRDKLLKVWDLDTGQELRTLEGHSNSVTGVALSPDGRRAVSASRDKTLKLWDLETGSTLRTLQGHSASVRGVAMSPDGRHAVSASADKTLKVWDLECDSAVRTLGGHSSFVYGVAVSPEGRHAVSASYDHTLKLWDLQSGEVEATFTCDFSVRCCAFASALTIVAGDSGGCVHFLSLELPHDG